MSGEDKAQPAPEQVTKEVLSKMIERGAYLGPKNLTVNLTQDQLIDPDPVTTPPVVNQTQADQSGQG